MFQELWAEVDKLTDEEMIFQRNNNETTKKVLLGKSF